MVEHAYSYHHSRDANQSSEPLYSPRHLSQSNPTSYHPARSQQTAPDLMLPTTTGADHPYLLQPVRPQQLGAEHLTPNSAVSSFNLPATYDAALLMTPVSMTGSPCLQTRTSPLISSDRDIKLSPTALSPYHLYHDEEDFASKYHLPMKHKNPTSTLQVQTNDAGFPAYVAAAPEPYYGAFGVSGTSAPGRVLPSSPSVHHSSILNSAGSRSSISYQSHHSTPPLSASSTVSYRSNDGTPILIAPNPLALRPATKKDKSGRRQLSVQSNESTSSSVSVKPRKRKSPAKDAGKKKRTRPESIPFAELELPEDLNTHERLLLDLTTVGLEWKEVVKRWTEETGQTLSVACVQMRKKRLMDRIKEYNAMHSTSEWEETWAASRNESGVNAQGGSPEAGSPRSWQVPRSTASPFHHGLPVPSYPEYSSAVIPSRLVSSHSADESRRGSGGEAPSQLYERSQQSQQLYSQQSQTSAQQDRQVKEERNPRGW